MDSVVVHSVGSTDFMDQNLWYIEKMIGKLVNSPEDSKQSWSFFSFAQ